MESIGLKPTSNSGAGWIEKEDGQNDYLIAQLKSTDAASMKISLRDIQILEAHAVESHKIPIFVIQYLSTGDTFILARPIDFEEVASYINTGVCNIPQDEYISLKGKAPKVKSIESSEGSRNSFWDNKRKEDEEWKKKSKQK